MMVAAITLLAMSGIGDVTDPELVMPMVLQKYLPIGVKGLVIAGLGEGILEGLAYALR